MDAQKMDFRDYPRREPRDFELLAKVFNYRRSLNSCTHDGRKEK